MAMAISGFPQAAGSKRPAGFLHELPKFFHLGNAFDGQSDDLGMGFDPESFFGSGTRALIDKK